MAWMQGSSGQVTMMDGDINDDGEGDGGNIDVTQVTIASGKYIDDGSGDGGIIDS